MSSSPSWRESILKEFTPEVAAVSRLTIVADPDQLLIEQGMLDEIRRRGFQLIPFDDHVAFRYTFESQYRQMWDRGEQTTLVVVLRATKSDVETLPYDLLEQAKYDSRMLSFSIAELFPKLAPQVVADLDRADFDAIFRAQSSHSQDRLGDYGTRDFLLRHVFSIVPELIKKPADLLHVLLQRHGSGQTIPDKLEDRFLELLRKSSRWKGWPLEDLVRNRSAFLGFLAERWPLYVKQQLAPAMEVRDSGASPPLEFRGPSSLPFGHDNVKVYVQDLFLGGQLTPTDVVAKSSAADSWISIGVAGDPASDACERLRGLLSSLEAELDEGVSSHRDWLRLAWMWAGAVAARWQAPAEVETEVLEQFESLHLRVETEFGSWMLTHYASLHNVAFLPAPVMVHQIPRFLAHHFVPTGAGAPDSAPGKVALLVVDGLALDQWSLLRETLAQDLGKARLEEGAAFAWVPTLTSVSRQAIFSGDIPHLFAASIGGTYKEPSHWARFWEDHGARKVEVDYICQKKDEDEKLLLERIQVTSEHPKRRVLGIVIGTIDKAIHGTNMGTGGLHATVRHWGETRTLNRIVSLLRDAGYEIYLTSDHGNVEARGVGKPKVGVIADERGERVHVFPNDVLLNQVHEAWPDAVRWPPIGLPDDYRPLLAPGLGAFVSEGTGTVAHGGIAIEEVIVPFIRIGAKA